MQPLPPVKDTKPQTKMMEEREGEVKTWMKEQILKKRKRLLKHINDQWALLVLRAPSQGGLQDSSRIRSNLS